MPEPETPLAERPWENVDRLLPVEAVLERVLAAVAPLPAVSVPLLEARGLVLAEPVVAGCDVPPFRNSAMDGYAVRAVDAARAAADAPVRLNVTGLVAAGDGPGASLEPGCAIRIMTGAPLPAAADAVVRFEETDEGQDRPGGGATVAIYRAPRPGDNVREAGEDIPVGSEPVPTGIPLRPAHLGLLAAIGRTHVPVHRRPRVAILSTGDELGDPAAPLLPGRIRDSNATTLAAMAAEWGAEVAALGIARDRLADVRAALARALGADLIVTSGGVSVGDFDMVKDALRAEGRVAVWQVRMKPGKPLAFGDVGGVPLLGLPGNPAAAAVSFEVFGRPAVRRLLGFADVLPPTVPARLRVPLDNRGMRRHYVRAWLERDADGEWSAVPVDTQGAGVLSSLARANALLVVPETVEVARAGSRLMAIPLD